MSATFQPTCAKLVGWLLLGLAPRSRHPTVIASRQNPHVYIWGVGWLPRRWQKAYVEFRKGISYEFTQLLSVRETRALFRRYTKFEASVLLPQVPPEEIVRFSVVRKFIARSYNHISRWRLLALLLRLIGPFFCVIARKSNSSS